MIFSAKKWFRSQIFQYLRVIKSQINSSFVPTKASAYYIPTDTQVLFSEIMEIDELIIDGILIEVR